MSLDVTNPMAAVFELGGTGAGTNLNPGDSCTIIALFSKPTNPATGYHALVNILPQLGDRYDMIVVASGCP